MNEKRDYHHGKLKPALIQAGRSLLEQSGLTSLTLRKCAELSGVSHTAPKNHFQNLAGLRSAIAATGYHELAQAMSPNQDQNLSPQQYREHALLGYVAFADQNPALYELMFARENLNTTDPDLSAGVRECYLILVEISDGLGWYSTPTPYQSERHQLALWSLVHGYAQLRIANRLKKEQMQALTILDLLPQIR